MYSKKDLTERDICTKFITPALVRSGWDVQLQVLEEFAFTHGRIYVKGKLTARGEQKRADYILFYKPGIPVAIIEAKDNHHSVGAGMQQGLRYAEILDIPCVFSSNGDGFIFHDRTLKDGQIEREISLEEFPTPDQLWLRYKFFKGLQTTQEEQLAAQEYFTDGSGRTPRYYQQIAINRTVEAIAKGQNRILLVMATGTGKTYTAFQIIYRLWKAGLKKRILFLADRTALIDQTRRGDFKHFRDKMTIIKKKVIEVDGDERLVSTKKRGIVSSDKAYEVFLGLYQGLSDADGIEDAYKDFSPEFFDLVVVDECHRGSAADDSAWRRILDYFSAATQIGMTATPKETADVSNAEYFGDPVYTYSLRQGIDDGFLAPYRVVRIGLDIDLNGWRPPKGFKDKFGNPVEDRIYNRSDFDKNIVIEERRKQVARKVTEFLRGTNRMDKTIMFCVDIEHAEGMRQAMINENPDLVAENSKYVMRITGDSQEGKNELDNFISPEEKYPVITTTSKLMTTGVDAQTCKVIVLDCNIQSMTEFKQIIGRGTRINEDFGKLYFTILDFRNVTDLFADPDFDGDPVRVKVVDGREDISGIEEEEETSTEPIIDGETGEEIVLVPPKPYPEPWNTPVLNYHEKVFVNGVDVTVLLTREMYFDAQGKPITVSLKDYTREKVKKQFSSLDDFLTSWNKADRKEAIVKELEAQGVLVDALENAVNKELDLFDLICHTAFDAPPLTRKERANNVKKRNYFTKYGDTARKVLEKLLDKYADEGLENLESLDVLKVTPFDEFGTPKEIIESFGGRENYLKAIRDLENQIYISA
jgi:type I restriction enzyme R subunit